MKNTLIYESLSGMVEDFLKPLTLKEISDLSTYLLYKFDEKPTELQHRFIKEFFNEIEFFSWIQYEKNPKDKSEFFHPYMHVKEHLNLLRTFVNVSLVIELDKFFNLENKSSLYTIALTEISKLTKEVEKLKKGKIKLKADLKQAMADSVEDDVFYKDDGFCNIADVLVEHKLLKLEEWE